MMRRGKTIVHLRQKNRLLEWEKNRFIPNQSLSYADLGKSKNGLHGSAGNPRRWTEVDIKLSASDYSVHQKSDGCLLDHMSLSSLKISIN